MLIEYTAREYIYKYVCTMYICMYVFVMIHGEQHKCFQMYRQQITFCRCKFIYTVPNLVV